MKIKPQIGLRAKLSLMIVILVMALSAVLTLYGSSYLGNAINQEFMRHASSIAGLLQSSSENANGAGFTEHMQQEIDGLKQHDSELSNVKLYMPAADGTVTVAASSDHGDVGGHAGVDDMAPIKTGETRFVEEDEAGDPTMGDSSQPEVPAGTAEMLSPLRDQAGNIIASVGVYLSTTGRDALIRSQQARFLIISNLALLALIAALYFSLNRMLIRPVKRLTSAAGALSQHRLEEQPLAIERRDEIGDLARAFGQLSESLSSRDEEVELLLDASTAVSSTLHLDNILQSLCEKIAASGRVAYCRISLLAPDGRSLIVRASSPTRSMDWGNAIGHELDPAAARHHDQVLKCGEPLILRRNGDINTPAGDWEWALTPETRSALLLPLRSKEEIIGVVMLGEERNWDERMPASAKKIGFYQTLMNHASVAIEHARLYEKTQRQVRELSAMHKISQDFTSSLDYEEVIGVVSQRVGQLVGAQFASVLLPDSMSRFLNIVASHNLSAEYIRSVNRKRRIPLGTGPIGSAFSRQQPVVVEDVFADAGYENWKHIAAVQGYSSLIAMPLRAKNQSIGVICIYFAEPRLLRPDEVELLMTAANEAAIAIENARIHEDLQDAFIGTIRSLAETIDAKDSYTRGHSEQVSLYSEAIARELGLGAGEMQTIRYAGYLHDIGKIGVPDAILTKPDKLTLDEFQVIKNHPVMSDRILEPAGFPFPVQPIVRHHHERLDGKGYPDGLANEEIPLGARILFVADAYEAMTSDRPYRNALSTERALEELVNNRGTQFDPHVVDAFVRIVSADESAELRLRKGA